MHEFLDSAPLWVPGSIAMLALLSASAFFSGSETALFYLSQDELRTFRLGRPRERVAAALLGDPDRLLTAILFWNLLVNMTYFAVGVVVGQRLVRADQEAAAGAFGLASLFTIILFGEVLPKTFAAIFRRTLAPLASWPVAAAVRLLDPLIPPLRFMTRVAHRTFWPHVAREPYLDAADLERAVESTALTEAVVRQEREVLHNILALSELTVEEIMRPRGTYLSLTAPVHLPDLKGEVPPADCVLIQEPDSDDVAAAIPLAGFSTLPERHLEQAAEEVVQVPWCADLAGTLSLLRERLCDVAGVVNEYGETIGIVTFEDIMETILLPQASRARRVLHREPVLPIEEDRWQVEGLTTLRYLCRRLQIDYEPDPEEPVTVAGMLQDQLEHVPAVGDECHWRGMRLTVIEAEPRGRMRVIVSRHQPAEGAGSTFEG
jgi:putative hemolysin